MALWPCFDLLHHALTSHLLFFHYRFLRAAQIYGVPEVDLFPANDLWELKNIAVVTQTIFAIGRAVS